MKILATTYLEMRGRCDELESRISALISHINPYISNMIGSGPVIAAELLVSIGENPGRIPSEAALAQLCGVAPLPASSGRTTRHRLNRGGDRRANSALYRIAVVRMAYDQRTKEYVAKRTAEGLSKKEIIRCLKRVIVREVYRIVCAHPHPASTDGLSPPRVETPTSSTAPDTGTNSTPPWMRPARISDIETGRRPLKELTIAYE